MCSDFSFLRYYLNYSEASVVYLFFNKKTDTYVLSTEKLWICKPRFFKTFEAAESYIYDLGFVSKI